MTHAQKHTHLQTAPTPPADQSLQKSVFLPTQKRILFFSPSLRCFNFFATHYRHINNSTHTVKVFINKHFQTRWTRTPAANMRNCCTTTLSHLQILKNDLIKSLLSVLVFELCFFLSKKFECFIMELMRF
jgi:hypothetical protein